MFRIDGNFIASALAACVLALGTQPSYAQHGPSLPGGGYQGVYPDDGCLTQCAEPGGDFNRPVRVALADGGRYEFVVIGPEGQSDAVRDAVGLVGGSIIRSNSLSELGQISQVATFPNFDAYQSARADLAALAPQSGLGPHHLYRFAQSRRSPRVYAPSLIGDAEPGHCRISQSITIGMIDGPVNTDHPALSGVDVVYESVVDSRRQPNADHGTAVAALLVGEDGSGALSGFARGARLYAVSVFSRDDAGEGASVERIAMAIDRMINRGVRLINLSIAGPENPALEAVLRAAAQRGVVMIAASGNDRRAQVAWPAASQDVIAVTAVDARRRRFRMANTGAQVEFSAPGVDVYAARANGAGYVTGTSFATPIVTALAARQMARGVTSTDAIRSRLRDGVETLGPGARNTDFGWGLVKAGGC